MQCFQKKLYVIYNEITKGIKIRNRSNWYELSEKSNKFFLNLEKYRANDNTTRRVNHDSQEITDHKKITMFIRSLRKIFEETENRQ